MNIFHDICPDVLNMKNEAVQKEFKNCIECGACYISCPFDLWGFALTKITGEVAKVRTVV